MSVVAPERSVLPEKPQAPVGIGGWLILPAIGLVVSLVLSARALWGMLSLMGSSALPSKLAQALPFLFFLGAAFSVLQVVVAVSFFNKKAGTPNLMVVYLLANVAVAILTAVLLGEAGARTSGAEREIGRAVAVAAIWIPYFRVSRRVKATFVN